MSAKCRSCGAPIIWAKTPAGKAIPLDPVPVADGNIVLEEDNAGAIAHPRSGQFGGVGVFYKSHFATCPEAAQHRRPRPAPGEALRRQIETARGQAMNARELAHSPTERAITATLMSLVNVVAELAERKAQ